MCPESPRSHRPSERTPVLVRLGSSRALARRAALGSLAASLGVVGLPAAVASAAKPTAPFISEIHYDNASTDVDEFVEVQLPAGTSSEGWRIFFYNGNGGVLYPASPNNPNPSTALPGATAPVDAPAVVVVGAPSGGIQNGDPDGLALVRSDNT